MIDPEGHLAQVVDIAPAVQDVECVGFEPVRARALLLSERTRTLFDVDLATPRIKAVYPLTRMIGGADIQFQEHGPEGPAIGNDGEVIVVIEYPPRLLRI